MPNPWVRFSELVKPGARVVVTVAAQGGDGTSVVTLRDGSQMRVQGDSVAVGDRAVIQQGRITGGAPGLPLVDLEI